MSTRAGTPHLPSLSWRQNENSDAATALRVGMSGLGHAPPGGSPGLGARSESEISDIFVCDIPDMRTPNTPNTPHHSFGAEARADEKARSAMMGASVLLGAMALLTIGAAAARGLRRS